MSASGDQTGIVANNKPVFGWVFMIVWISLLAPITWFAFDADASGYSNRPPA
jgi:hypothetical protein